MPSSTSKPSKTSIHRRVAAATLATFALLLGVVTFAGTPLPQTATTATGTTAAQRSTATTTSSASDTTSTTAQPASSTASGRTSDATLTTSTS